MSFIPVDIEDELRTALTSNELSVFAPPVPEDLSTRVPCAMVRRLGGVKKSLVVDSSNVIISVWAETDAEAMYHANNLVGKATELQFDHETIRRIDIVTEPYQNNDPIHPTLARASFSVQVTSKSK